MDFFIVIAVYSLKNSMTAITISRCIKEKASIPQEQKQGDSSSPHLHGAGAQYDNASPPQGEGGQKQF
jgi:hypothetical protein